MAQRTLAGMFFSWIKKTLNVTGGWNKMPGEATAGVPGLEAAIPQQRTGRIGRRRILHDGNRLIPRVNSVGDASFVNEFVDKKIHLGHWHFLLQCDQTIPYELCIVQVTHVGE